LLAARPFDTVPPKIVLNQASGLTTNQDPTITGIVTDNLAVALLQIAREMEILRDLSTNQMQYENCSTL
jgi:hypothetical protein